MDDEQEIANVFAIPDFWQSSGWLEQSLLEINRGNPLFSLDLADTPHIPATGNETEVLAHAGAGFFKLPLALKELTAQEACLQPTPKLEDSEANTKDVVTPDEDLWLAQDQSIDQPPEYKTWDEFDGVEHEQPPAILISEAGSAAFDALITSPEFSSRSNLEVVDEAAYVACLITLALGRASLLFSWDAAKKTFVKLVPHLRTSGLSVESLEGVDRLCFDCANAIKFLQLFSERTYSASPSPAKVALAGVVDQLVPAIQAELGVRGRRVRSILQLQSIVQPVHSVLTYFRRLVEELSRERNDEGVLSRLFLEAHSAEYRNDLLRAATREVLRLVAKPWTDFVEEWIGLKAEEGIVITKHGPGKSFVKVADRMWIDDQGFELEESDFFLDEDKMPSFIAHDTGQAIFEIGRNLRFIKEHHPDHPLSQQSALNTSAKPPKLEWRFDWNAIKQLEADAREYKASLYRAIQDNLAKDGRETRPRQTQGPLGFELKFFGKSEDDIVANVAAAMEQINRPLGDNNLKPTNGLARLLQSQLYQRGEASVDETFSPHWSLVPELSFGPVIDAQARIVNRECVKLLFTAHHLRTHIALLKQYYLFGNGLFCSRLSHALFDPDLDTAERKSGVALSGGNMGLRLSGRDNWPPASSELRLALMGVLSESYEAPSNTDSPRSAAPRSYKSDLPGHLSFGVRDLAPEEIERCMDQDSVEALDFLRLSYKPPSPLRPVMTPMILEKYDRIYKLLLRLIRMLYVVNQLSRDDTVCQSTAGLRFRIESHHFVSQIAAHFFDTGIGAPWRRFEAWLNSAEAESVQEEGLDATTHSPDTLRDHHEQVLDEIMVALFLRKRQLPVLKLLEDIFALVLRFAKSCRVPESGGESETPEKLYASYKKKMQVFITVCRGLSENSSSSGQKSKTKIAGRTDDDSTTVDRLLLMLDMAGFYVKREA
ncbi:Spc98 family-domain-containing protein [Diplogelasinospora grovesii]|uniref:Spindle pole body component n=1 Tax=Diplogelasinospora grovesii TaxID=303347 RepID=A0AAN6N9H4_9PEZI|nr:Spc98 family-domain-containing protein [Diplogelasinospora grovesii]